MQNDVLNFTPNKDKVLLLILKDSEQEGGIFIPEAAQGKQKPYEMGIVKALGPEANDFVPELKIGMKVIAPKHGHEKWKMGDEMVTISVVRANRIEGIVEE